VTRAPELGWSPQAKQMIASWTVGWMKPPAEKTAPEAVASSKAPPVPAIDSAQVQQIAQSLAALRETVGQIAASEDQTSRETARLESAVAELILKFPEPSAQPPAAPARKPAPVQPPCKTQRRQSQMRNIAFASRAAGILFLGGIHITSGYGRGLSLDMGGHHASYRANPGRPLFLLPVLRCALFGDVFAAVEER
jgi:hypothetical protein